MTEIADDFYKQPIDVIKCNILKGTKRMSNAHYIGLFQRLLDRASAKDFKISRLEYARLRIDYEFQRRDSLLRYEITEVEHDISEPDYVKNNEIAGYYGNVSLEALKTGFCNYFPMYQQAETSKQAANVQEVAEANNSEVSEEDIMVDVVSLPKAAQNLQTVPLFNDKSPDKSQPTPRSHKRKNSIRDPSTVTRKSARISQMEIDSALSNLQKEFDSRLILTEIQTLKFLCKLPFGDFG